MSRVGHGMFSYIPDASMIGTCPCLPLNICAPLVPVSSPFACRVSHHPLPASGTVFCNFIANALCVVHSVIDVQVELSVRSWLTCLSNPFLTPLPLFHCSRVPNSTRQTKRARRNQATQ